MEFETFKKTTLRISHFADAHHHSFETYAKCVGPRVVYVNDSHVIGSEWKVSGKPKEPISEVSILFASSLEEYEPVSYHLGETKTPIGKGTIRYSSEDNNADVSLLLPLAPDVYWRVFEASQTNSLSLKVRLMLPYGDDPDGMDQVLADPYEAPIDYFYSEFFIEHYFLEVGSPLSEKSP